MTLKKYFTSLNDKEQGAYAKKAGTTVGYIKTHLIYGRKLPRPGLMEGLAKASNGKISQRQLLNFFYKD